MIFHNISWDDCRGRTEPGRTFHRTN